MMRYGLLIAAACLAGCSFLSGKDDRSDSVYGSSDGSYVASKPRPLSAQEAATDKNVIGCVKVEYLIKPDGSASDVRILESVPAGYFDARVLLAMEKMRFQPRNAIAFATRTFSFAPKQTREVLDSAAKLCEHSAQAPLPPPPEGGLIEDSEPRPIGAPSSESPRRPIGKH